MTRRTFTVFAWLTMVSALSSLPMTYLAYTLGGRSDAAGTIMQGGMQVVGTVLFVAITLMLKRFLNRLFAFNIADQSIDLMVITSIVAGLVILGGICYPKIKEAAEMVALIMMVIQGVLQSQLGYKLLQLPNNLGGMLKPFCYLNMATGVCLASLVLMLVGVVLSALSDLMLATIYFTIAKELKEVELSRPEPK